MERTDTRKAREDRSQPSQAVILAGGLGTRLGELTRTRPKAMIEVNRRPFLEYLVEQLRDQGIQRILLLLGYLPEPVINHFGDGSRFGVQIDYGVTEVDCDTGRRLSRALPLMDEVFCLLYCDNYWPMDLAAMWSQFERTNVLAQVTAYDNGSGISRDNLSIEPSGIVKTYDKSRTAPGLRGVDIGYAILDRKVVEALPADNVNFEAWAYPRLVDQGLLGAFVSSHRYYSIGSPERIPIMETYFNAPPAVILDRDGVLNVKQPKACYVRTPEQFQWIEGSRRAVALLNEAGFITALATNQAGIARGVMTTQNLDQVHDAMIKGLAKRGAHLDGIYYCPHGWDEGCSCRKPAPGMLFAAQSDLHFNMSQALFIGDDERDREAGQRAGCRTRILTDNERLIDVVREMLGIPTTHRPDSMNHPS